MQVAARFATRLIVVAMLATCGSAQWQRLVREANERVNAGEGERVLPQLEQTLAATDGVGALALAALASRIHHRADRWARVFAVLSEATQRAPGPYTSARADAEGCDPQWYAYAASSFLTERATRYLDIGRTDLAAADIQAAMPLASAPAKASLQLLDVNRLLLSGRYDDAARAVEPLLDHQHLSAPQRRLAALTQAIAIGRTNTAVAEAHLAYSPLVVLAGAITRADLGKDTFQEVDQVALFQPICKRSLLVTDPARLPAMVEDAIRLAMSGRKGPVVLHVPRDLWAAEIPAPKVEPVTIAQAGPPAAEEIDRIITLMSKAKKPVIVAGGGFKWGGGSEILQKLAEKLEIPVVASTGHADVMPHGHPWFAGQGGPRGNSAASGLTRDADLLLVLGARLAFNSTFHSTDYISAEAEIIQVDIEGSAIGRYFPVSIGLLADAGRSAEAILAKADSLDSGIWSGWQDRFRTDMAGLAAERQTEANDPTLPMHPRRALAEIRKALPKDAIVTLDTGNTCLQAADRLAHYQSPGLITPLDFGLVGFGYAAALGAKAACPDRPVVSIMGDGGFGFTMAEVTSAVRHKLPVVSIVLDNAAWGAEKAYQQEFYENRLLGAEIDSPAYDKYAE